MHNSCRTKNVLTVCSIGSNLICTTFYGDLLLNPDEKLDHSLTGDGPVVSQLTVSDFNSSASLGQISKRSSFATSVCGLLRLSWRYATALESLAAVIFRARKSGSINGAIAMPSIAFTLVSRRLASVHCHKQVNSKCWVVYMVVQMHDLLFALLEWRGHFQVLAIQCARMDVQTCWWYCWGVYAGLLHWFINSNKVWFGERFLILVLTFPSHFWLFRRDGILHLSCIEFKSKCYIISG